MFDFQMSQPSQPAPQEQPAPRPTRKPLVFWDRVKFLVLMAAGTERTRINPRLSDDVAPLVGWLSLPVLLVAPLTRSDAALGHLVRIVKKCAGQARVVTPSPTLLSSYGGCGIKPRLIGEDQTILSV